MAEVIDKLAEMFGAERTDGESDADLTKRVTDHVGRLRGTKDALVAAVAEYLGHSDFFILDGGETGWPGEVLALICRPMTTPEYEGLINLLQQEMPVWLSSVVKTVDDPEQAAALRSVLALGGVEAARKFIVE